MADNFERAKDEILRRKAGNGGPDNSDILQAMSALAQDGDDQHAESIAEIKDLRTVLATHFEQAAVRDRRLDRAEAWQRSWEKGCPERMRKAISEAMDPLLREHETNHPPRRRSDPKDADYTGDRRVWLMWTIGSRVTNILIAVVTAIIIMALSYLLFGSP